MQQQETRAQSRRSVTAPGGGRGPSSRQRVWGSPAGRCAQGPTSGLKRAPSRGQGPECGFPGLRRHPDLRGAHVCPAEHAGDPGLTLPPAAPASAPSVTLVTSIAPASASWRFEEEADLLGG